MPTANETLDTTYAACPDCLAMNKISLSKALHTKPICGACKTEIDFHGAFLNANTKQTQKLIAKSPIPVVIDFWAPWCGPCKMFAPTFERVAKEAAARAVFVKLNTENDPVASPTFGVRGIPTLALYRRGTEVDRQAGAVPYETFKSWITTHI